MVPLFLTRPPILSSIEGVPICVFDLFLFFTHFFPIPLLPLFLKAWPLLMLIYLLFLNFPFSRHVCVIPVYFDGRYLKVKKKKNTLTSFPKSGTNKLYIFKCADMHIIHTKNYVEMFNSCLNVICKRAFFCLTSCPRKRFSYTEYNFHNFFWTWPYFYDFQSNDRLRLNLACAT
jgi:hypothetical protein